VKNIIEERDIMHAKSELALRLKMLRKERGLTSDQVAEAVGVKSATYRRYEIDTKPKDSIYLALAQYFGVTVDFLMSGRSPKAETCIADGSDYSSGSELVELSEKEIAFIVKLRSLSQKDRDEIMNFMEWKKSQSSAGAK
jgi:transcriptional regulator with XRE-family HTH domain